MQALAVRRRPRPTADAAQKDPGLQNHAEPRQCGTVSSATFTASMAPWQQLWHLNGSPPLSVLRCFTANTHWNKVKRLSSGEYPLHPRQVWEPTRRAFALAVKTHPWCHSNSRYLVDCCPLRCWCSSAQGQASHTKAKNAPHESKPLG